MKKLSQILWDTIVEEKPINSINETSEMFRLQNKIELEIKNHLLDKLEEIFKKPEKYLDMKQVYKTFRKYYGENEKTDKMFNNWFENIKNKIKEKI